MAVQLFRAWGGGGLPVCVLWASSCSLLAAGTEAAGSLEELRDGFHLHVLACLGKLLLGLLEADCILHVQPWLGRCW